MNELIISKTRSLPLDAVTQTFADLAVKGSGKTYLASVMAEEMLKAGQQVAIIDYTGAWWGLQSSADGKSEGFPVVVFGGDHANIPLEETAGEIIARAIIEQEFSAIIDLSLFRKNQSLRFLTPFLETLYRLNRKPIHLFADEADAYCPQKVFGEQARTVGAMEDIVRRGRKKGIGCTLITQRPASINKDVLTQCEILLALRMSHPRDIAAIKEWVDVHATIQQAKDMITDLPSLAQGEAYIWSPSWLRIFEKMHVRKRETFDSGATPKPGEIIRQPKKLAAIDIEKLGAAISETVERKKSDDPKELKKKISELQKEVNKKSSQPSIIEKQIDPEIIEKFKTEILKHKNNSDEYYKIIQTIKSYLMKYQTVFAKIGKQLAELNEAGVKIDLPEPEKIQMPHVKFSIPVSIKAEVKVPEQIQKYITPPTRRPLEHNGNGFIPAGEKKILAALIQYPNGLKRTQLTVLTSYKQSSRDTYIGKLVQKGYIEIIGTGFVKVTKVGIDALPNYEPLPKGEELQKYCLHQLPEGERKILQVLIDAYPETVSRSQLTDSTGYKQSSRDTYIGKLSNRELITLPSTGIVKASDSLFE